MAKSITFEGKSYTFPDDATDAEMIEALEAMTAEQAPAPVVPPALPLPEAVPPTPTFAPALPEREVIAAERDAAREATRARVEPAAREGSAMASERARLEQERKTTQVSINTGADKPTVGREDFVLPSPFRATRIREVVPVEPTVTKPPGPLQGKVAETGSEVDKLRARYRNLQVSSLAPEVKGRAQELVLERLVSLGAYDALSDNALDGRILATGDDKELKELAKEKDRREKIRADETKAMKSAQVIASAQPPSPPKEGARLYRDPSTGELREPSAWEELTEAFSKQQVMSEEAARQSAARIARQQAEVDRRVAGGETFAWTDYAGPLFSGILSTRESTGAGTTETELGAALRGTLGSLSALAAEGYFRGLGYEVNAKGEPVDPEDFGYAVADVKRAINEKAGFTVIPDVVYPLQFIGKPVRVAAELAGGPEWEATVENLLASVPQLAVPTPGVKTESTQRKVYFADPEGRRRVSSIEVPSPLSDPAGFVNAETRRLARNIAAGRTFGDEFMDAPDVRDWYANVWGDEDAAFWGGSVAELAIPAGPGTAAKAGKAAGRYLLGTSTAGKAAGALIDAAEASKIPGVSATGLRGAVLNPLADVAAAVVPGKPSDARVVRRVAERIIDDMNLPDQVKSAAKNSIKPTSQTLVDVMEDVGPVLDPTYVSPFRSLQAKTGEFLVQRFDAILAQMGPAQASKWALLQLKNLGGTPPTGTVPLTTLRQSLLGAPVAAAKAAGTPELVTPDVARIFLPSPVPGSRPPRFSGVRQVGQQSGLEALERAKATDTSAAMGLIADANISGAARHFGIQLGRNLPDDMVMISENIAVPRAMAKQARADFDEMKKMLFMRPVTEIRTELQSAIPVTRMTPGSSAEAAYKRMVKVLDKANGRFLTVAERKAFDKAHDVWVKKSGATGRFAVPTYFHSRRPAEVAGMLRGTAYQDLAAELAQAPDWFLVKPETMRFLAERYPEPVMMTWFAGRSRLARDLTAAQVGYNNWLAAFDSPEVRRGLALFKKRPFTETVSMRQARQAIRSASETAIRNLGTELTTKAKALGSYDEAINRVFSDKTADISADEAWTKVLEAMYGSPEVAKEVKAAVVANAQNMPGITFSTTGGVTQFASTPTVEMVKVVDRFFVDGPGFKGRSNFRGDLFEPQLGRFGFNGLTSMFTPDYHKAFLKVMLEEGVRKELPASARRNEALMSSVDNALGNANAFTPNKFGQDLQARLIDQTRNPVQATSFEVPNYGASGSARVRVYDPALSETERLIAESGEGFVKFAESVEPRMRADVLEMAKGAYDWLVLGPGRNFQSMAKYGYMIPNVPYLAGKLLEVPVLSAVTSGLARTSEAMSHWPTVMLRRNTGAPLYLPDGRVYTGQQILDLAREQGLGLSTVEAERIGSLADDILRDARQAARQQGGASTPAWALIDEANPFSKVLGQRIAEAMEVSYRQAMFEARLLAGDSVPDAAQAARRSLLDYSEVPGVVKDFIGRYVAEAATQWQLTVELARLAVENPQAARAYYKAMQTKQREEDPYAVHGDKALKSLGMVNVDGQDYFVPGFNKAYLPVEAALLAARSGVSGLAMLGRIANAPEGMALAEGAAQTLEGGIVIGRQAIDQALPTLMQAIQAGEQMATGEVKYSATDVPRADKMTDEGRFWAAAVWAHHMDPDRSKGYWNAFLSAYQPDFIRPPKENAAYPDADEDDARAFFWKSAPKNTPYLVWGRDEETGETIYKSFEPSEYGKLNIAVARKLPLAEIAEKAGWVTAATLEAVENPAARPTAIRPTGLVPTVKANDPKSYLKFFLPQAPTPAAERERQAAELSEADKTR